MLMRQKQNRVLCKNSKAESWMFEKLRDTDYKWTRQARWGIRLFDFWNHQLGIAIEVDGKEHNVYRDRKKDEIDYKVSGITVYRVRNFCEEDANHALIMITRSESWNERRQKMGLKQIK